MIDLYSWSAPNGHKVHILIEELGIPYRIVPVNITTGAQHEEVYRAINPNGKIPAIVDHAPLGGGPSHTVFETGAILLYLAEKEQRFLPEDMRARSDVIQWLFWQVGGLGPMMGQAQHFFRYASEQVPYGIARYQKETRRLLKVMDDRLQDHEYLGGAYSIADMACFPWIRIHKLTGIDLDEFPNIQAWYSRIRARPALDRALNLLREQWVDVSKSDEAKRNLFQKG
jgi:GST-like protein